MGGTGTVERCKHIERWTVEAVLIECTGELITHHSRKARDTSDDSHGGNVEIRPLGTPLTEYEVEVICHIPPVAGARPRMHETLASSLALR